MRFNRNAVTILTTLALLCGVAATTGAFERRIGGRPMGMGDAFVALADDINALNYNPAGLALGQTLAVSLEYANVYPGLDDGRIQENHLNASLPLGPWGAVGLTWNNRSVESFYSENEFMVGYGVRPFPDLPLWAGAAVKLFYLGYGDGDWRELDAFFKDHFDTYQFGIDLGVLYTLLDESETVPGVRVGLSIRDVNQPDLGLRTAAVQDSEARLGACLSYLNWAADVDVLYQGSEYQTNAGVEYWFQERRIAARAGVISGTDTGFTLTVGGTYQFDVADCRLGINYAFNYSFNGILETAGLHRVSLDVYGFGLGVAGPSAPPQSEWKHAPSEKIVRVKNYLLDKINLYLSISQNLETLRQAGNPDVLPRLEPIEKAMRESVGQLIMDQDMIGFLKQFEEAVGLYEQLEHTLAPGVTVAP